MMECREVRSVSGSEVSKARSEAATETGYLQAPGVNIGGT
jgi:hypothetical protein